MVNKIEAYIVDLLDLFQQWHSFASEMDLRGNLSSRSELGRKSLGWLARKKSLGWLASRRSRTWLCPPRSHLVGFNPIRSGGVYPEGQRRRAWRSEPQRLRDSIRKSRISGENLQKILEMDRKSLSHTAWSGGDSARSADTTDDIGAEYWTPIVISTRALTINIQDKA